MNSFRHLSKCLDWKGKAFKLGCNSIQVRSSQYPSYFIDPIFKPDDLDQLFETGEAKDKIYVPVKAAKNDENCSLFRDDLLNKFINMVMRQGKKALARDLVEKAFEKVKCIQIERYHKAEPEDKKDIILNPLTIFHTAVENCKPLLDLTPIKRGAITYQVPIPISANISRFKAMKWIIEAAKEKERTMHFPEKLAYELIDASKNEGRVVRRKQDLHKQCESNKAYAHFRWG